MFESVPSPTIPILTQFKTDMSETVFAPAQLGNITLSNHIVMAPMTRNRGTQDHELTDLIATYYAQRASAGLIITEGIAPSPNGNGYARVPGLYTPSQVAAWKKVTDGVHAKGGKIFAQLMHTGRIGHPANMHAGSQIVAPSAIAAAGDIFTDTEGMQPQQMPKAMSTEEVQATIAEFVQAAQNAVDAGFDGIELHAANGYLIEQFIRPTSNARTDQYGGSTENFARFALEIAQATAAQIGKDKVGIRLSPYGIFNDMPYSSDFDSIYAYLAEQLNPYVTYIHLVDHSAMGAPAVDPAIVNTIREKYQGTLILSGGYDLARAEATLQAGQADLIAMGRPFLSNPDLVERLQTGAPLNQPDFGTFYTASAEGYIDYPTLEEVAA